MMVTAYFLRQHMTDNEAYAVMTRLNRLLTPKMTLLDSKYVKKSGKVCRMYIKVQSFDRSESIDALTKYMASKRKNIDRSRWREVIAVIEGAV